MNRPNIVFFMVDQLSAKWLEVALGGACNLPNIRRLMGEGVSFRNAITSILTRFWPRYGALKFLNSKPTAGIATISATG